MLYQLSYRKAVKTNLSVEFSWAVKSETIIAHSVLSAQFSEHTLSFQKFGVDKITFIVFERSLL